MQIKGVEMDFKSIPNEKCGAELSVMRYRDDFVSSSLFKSLIHST